MSEPAGESPTDIAQAVIRQGIDLGATDIHIEPLFDSARVRLRVGGTLRQTLTLPKSELGELIARLKFMANMDVADLETALNGEMEYESGGRKYGIRVFAFPTAAGQAASLHISPKTEGK